MRMLVTTGLGVMVLLLIAVLQMMNLYNKAPERFMEE